MKNITPIAIVILLAVIVLIVGLNMSVVPKLGGTSTDTFSVVTNATSTVNTTSTLVLSASAFSKHRRIQNVGGTKIWCKYDGATTAASSTLVAGAGILLTASNTVPTNFLQVDGYTGVVNCLSESSAGTVFTYTD